MSVPMERAQHKYFNSISSETREVAGDAKLFDGWNQTVISIFFSP